MFLTCFFHVLDISNQEFEKESSGKEQREEIFGPGFRKFREDLGIPAEGDVSMLIIAYKFHCEGIWVITRGEFITGWTIAG